MAVDASFDKALTDWLQKIDQQFSDAQKRKLNRKLSMLMRQQTKSRIKAQQSTDGSGYEPRKRDQVNAKRRGAMFQRLSKHLKTKSNSRMAEVGFSARTGRIMKVHQHGETQRPSKDANPVKYPVREVVGFGRRDEKAVLKAIEVLLLSDL